MIGADPEEVGLIAAELNMRAPKRKYSALELIRNRERTGRERQDAIGRVMGPPRATMLFRPLAVLA